MNQAHFPGFGYPAEELSAYIFSIDTFIISLKTQEIIRHSTPDPDAFKQWLKVHHVRDISKQIGSLVYNHYFNKR